MAGLSFGVGALPKGKREDRLVTAIDDVITTFRGHVLPFDTEAARHCATLAVMARNAGHGFPMADGYIARLCRRVPGYSAIQRRHGTSHHPLGR